MLLDWIRFPLLLVALIKRGRKRSPRQQDGISTESKKQ
uniref:Uncharacterized protein n=1 Tax=Rhizophora mucronata TaxID=61149 RepID=A0A2P2N490_RHIMU